MPTLPLNYSLDAKFVWAEIWGPSGYALRVRQGPSLLLSGMSRNLMQYVSEESGLFRPWVVSPVCFALGSFALVLGVGRFALIM